jgi:transcriptional regulator with XRE-family HTH domain
MTLGQKIRKLRKELDLNQAELAKKIGSHPVQISTYENDKASPSSDVLIRLATAFNVSVDYLLKDKVDNMATTPIKDKELLGQFEQIDHMSEDERNHIKFLLQSIINNKKIQTLTTVS